MKEEVPVDFVINAGEILIAAVAAFKIWVDRKKIHYVEASEDKQGRIVLLKGFTHNKLIPIIDKLGLSKPKPQTKAKTKTKTKPRSRKSGREKRQ